jgi:hypothetical protein
VKDAYLFRKVHKWKLKKEKLLEWGYFHCNPKIIDVGKKPQA